MTIIDIAEELKEKKDSVYLIYAFNATGKTRLSVAYKNVTKEPDTGRHVGVYYNAFSEDLFIWDNDEENDGVNIKLKILPSSLNQFHSFLYENTDNITDKLNLYSPDFLFKLAPYENPEKGIEFISFFHNSDDNNPIKISRGEERIFVWCFFLALLEVDGWANEQNAHIFIDDPVSSMDDHNIYVTANTIFKLIEKYYLTKKIIVTTHHIGLFSILADRLLKGEKSSRYKNLTKIYTLNKIGNTYSLKTPGNSVFLFHLHLLELLDEASRQELNAHHVVLLRQVLENISSFLGNGHIGYVLSQIGIIDIENTVNTINSLSHKNAFNYQSDLLTPAMETFFRDVFEKLMAKYKFVIHEDKQ